MYTLVIWAVTYTNAAEGRFEQAQSYFTNEAAALAYLAHEQRFGGKGAGGLGTYGVQKIAVFDTAGDLLAMSAV